MQHKVAWDFLLKRYAIICSINWYNVTQYKKILLKGSVIKKAFEEKRRYFERFDFSLAHKQGDIYLFDYRSKISDTTGSALGIDFTRKRLRLNEIRNILAKSKNKLLQYVFMKKQKVPNLIACLCLQHIFSLLYCKSQDNIGAPNQNRTDDLILTMDALYLLSYEGI